MSQYLRKFPRQCRAVLTALAGGSGMFAGVPSTAQTLPQEIQVSKSNIPDFEFDSGRKGVNCPTCNFGNGNSRLSFADSDGKIWVGSVDFATGKFFPPDGHGILIDTNAAKPTDFGNGPEWVSSSSGSGLVYTKYLPGQTPSPATATLATAWMVNGSWLAEVVPGAASKVAPAGTLNENDPDPRINYTSANNNSLFYWRSLTGSSPEITIPSSRTDGAGRRWVEGTHKIIYQCHPANSPDLLTDQVCLYDSDNGLVEQLTSDPVGKISAFMWRAPEFNNEYVFYTMVDFRRSIQVYRKIPDVNGIFRWVVVKVITAPTSVPYFWSPEPFAHNGRSYIFSQVSSSLAFYDRTIPNHLAITGIDPLRQNFRVLTGTSSLPRLRLDPEYFITAQGPFIYYNRAVPETTTNPAVNDGVWRVDTGLGPRQ